MEISFAAPSMASQPSRIVGVSEGEMQRLQNNLEQLSTSIKRLKDELGGLCSSVVDLSEAEDPSSTAKCWMKQVEELCRDTEDYFDEVMHSGADIKILESRARYATARLDRFNIDPQSFSKRKIPSMRRPLLSLYGDLIINHGPMDKLENFLDVGTEKQLKLASLVGPEGVGKTTLVKKLYHEHSGQFDCRAFLRVSRKPDMRRLLTSMFIQIQRKRPSCRLDVQDLIDNIATYLLDKRYFIIIDDLWTTSLWDIISGAFSDGNHCSRIITTTQIMDVALASCSYQSAYRFKMVPLDDDQSRSLFFKIVPGLEDFHPDFREVSDWISRKCGGLPLAIINIASMLPSTVNFKELTGIRDYLPSTLRTNRTPIGMKEIVNIMYNNLRAHLKTCLLYFSMYPEDYTVRKDDLVKQWVAEGFLDGIKGKETKEIMGGYFDELVRRGMIQLDTDDNGEVLSCTLHHMVHDLIVNKSMEENFIITLDYFQSNMALPDKVRRLSVQFGGARRAHIPASIMVSQVRSLAVFGFFQCVPADVIVKYRLLRVLILHIWADRDEAIFDLSEIHELHRLRYVKIECNITVKLPDEIQGLQYLETLDVDATVAVIPSDIAELSRLSTLKLAVRELSAQDICILQELPNLTALLLHVLTTPAGRKIVFAEGGFPVLRYFEFTSTSLCLTFAEGAVQNVQRLKLRFNANEIKKRDLEQAGLKYLSGLEEISAEIGILGADEWDSKSKLLKDVFRKLPSSPIFKVQLLDRIIFDEKTCARNEDEHQTTETQDAFMDTLDTFEFDNGTILEPGISLRSQVSDNNNCCYGTWRSSVRAMQLNPPLG